MVTPDRLRFDFNLHRGLKESEIARVEELVNGWITEDTALVTREMPLAEAKAAGKPILQQPPLAPYIRYKAPFVSIFSKSIQRSACHPRP